MPVRDILLDAAGNRVLARGDYALADGAQAVRQGIECRLRLSLGEYWLDEAQGVDWLGTVLVRSPSRPAVRAEIQRAIAATPDVTRVTEVSWSLGADRRAVVGYSAASTEGVTSGTVVL